MRSQHCPPGDGTSWWPVVKVDTDKRYAIVSAGVVIAVVMAPSPTSVSLSLGQTLVQSDTLQVGDKS